MTETDLKTEVAGDIDGYPVHVFVPSHERELARAESVLAQSLGRMRADRAGGHELAVADAYLWVRRVRADATTRSA
jgi:hypothetical protein